MEGSADDDLVLRWVATGDHQAATTDEGGCPTCGFAGDLLDGPDDSVCPACLAEYPKDKTWRKLVRCPNCNLAIGVSDESAGKTIICSRCKCFIGAVTRAEARAPVEFSLDWVRQIPAWVWLGLAGWQLNKVLGTIVTPPVLTRLLPHVGIFAFLVLASCRVWLWRTPRRKQEAR